MAGCELRITDCLCPNSQRVDAFQRHRDVAGETDARFFVVFSETGEYMGIVTERQAALFPNRIFADLLLRRQLSPIADSTPIAEALQTMEQEGTTYLAISDAVGEFIGIVSRPSIIEALMSHERGLREQLERLLLDYQKELDNRKIAAAVFDATSEGIMVTDAEQRIILVNRAFCKTTGWTLEEAIGKTPQLLHSGRHDAAYYKNMWVSLHQDGAWEGEIWNRRKNGEIYPEWLHTNEKQIKDTITS